MIKSDIQKLDPGTIIELFEIDITKLGGGIERYHNGVNELGNDVIWQGSLYIRFPIAMSGLSKSSSGTLPRPNLVISNLGGFIWAVSQLHEGFIGGKVTRKRTFLKYLDAANFVAGNPLASPTTHFDDEVYFVDRKSFQDDTYIEFELASPWDVQGVKLPRGRVNKKNCILNYRGPECGYAGGPVADVHDAPTTDPTKDRCGKRLPSCKLRHTVLPFMAYINIQR